MAADLRPLSSFLAQEGRHVAVQPADSDDGERFLDGGIRRRRKSKPAICLRYGYLMAEQQPPDDGIPREEECSKKQVLDAGDQFLYGGEVNEVEVEVVGGDKEDENGDRVFEIYFSLDNRNYLVQLAFGPEEGSVDAELQEEGELGSGGHYIYYSDDDEETYEEDESDDEDQETYEEDESDDKDQETYEEDENVEDEETYDGDDEEPTNKRVFELYFPQDNRYYVVRLVIENEGERFVEEAEEFLYGGLQRAVKISYDGEEEDGRDYGEPETYEEDQCEDEDEGPANDDSSYAQPEIVPDISRKLIEEDGEKRSRIEYPETAREIKNEIAAHLSGSCVDPIALGILERQNHLIARILQGHLELHSPLAPST